MNYSRAFTMVEMLMAIAVISILASVLYVNFSDRSDREAKLTKARAFAVSVPLSLPTAFVSEWKFDGSTNIGTAAIAADLKDTWSANDGTPSATAPIVRNGNDCVSGRCLDFTSGSYASFGDNIRATSITVSLWVYPTTSSATAQSLVERTTGFGVRLFNEKARAVLNGTGGWHYYSGSTANVVMNGWNHIAMTYNSVTGDNYIYLNGEKSVKVTIAGAITYGSSYNLMMGIATGNTLPFVGKLDEVAIYKEAFSTAQVQSEYYAGLDSLHNSGAISTEEYAEKKGICLAMN